MFYIHHAVSYRIDSCCCCADWLLLPACSALPTRCRTPKQHRRGLRAGGYVLACCGAEAARWGALARHAQPMAALLAR
jgi:hypothetical protein